MAGIQGMGSAKKLVPQDDLNIQPQGVNFQASVPQDDEDFSSLIDEALASNQTPEEEDFSGLIDQALSGSSEFTSDPIGMMEELSQFPARAKAAMQVTDKEIQQSLEQSFGKDRVRNRNNHIEYKAKDDKWRVWDAGVEISDFTTDLIRPVIEEIPASLATIAAAVPAVASMIASSGITLPAGAAAIAAARSGGALLGQATADFLQSLTGVERDKDRSAVLEYGLTAVLAPASGLLADYATKKIAQSAAKSTAKKLMPANELYKQEITGIKESLAKVKELGGMENIPGTDTPLILSQLNPSNPRARELTEKAANLNGYKEVQEQITQGFEDSSKSFIKTLGNINPENMKSGKEFQDYVELAFSKEGGLIEDVRKSFSELEGAGSTLRIPNMSKKVEDFAVSIGFDNVKAKGSKDFTKQWAESLVSEGYDKGSAKLLADKTDKILTKVVNSNGKMKANELLGMYEEINGVFRNISKKGLSGDPLLKSKVGELRRIVTDQLNTSIGEVAGGDVQKSYVKSLARYTELSGAADEFEKLLDKNTLASHSLSKAIFNKGPNGLDTANAAKVILRSRPDLLNDVKGSFLQDSMAEFNIGIGKTDWVKFNKKMNDPQLKPVMDSLFGKEGMDGLKAYQTVAKAIEDGSVGAANSSERALFLKNMGLAAAAKSPVLAGRAGIDMLHQAGSTSAFAEIISKEGIDNFLKTAPRDSKPILKKLLTGVQQVALRAGQVSEIPLRRLGKDASEEKANEIHRRGN